MFHGFHLPTSVAVRIEAHPCFVGLIIGPDCAIQDLERCLSSFGSYDGNSECMERIVEQSLGRANGYVVSYSGAIRWGNFNSRIQLFATFKLVSSTEVCVQVHEGSKVGSRAGILVVEWLLKEGTGEYLNFVLQGRVRR